MNQGLKQFLLFSVVGAVGTSGQYAVLILLVEVSRQNPVLASTLGFLVGALINYILNYRYTFKSDKPHRETLAKFLVVAAIGACINTGLMYVLIEAISLQYLIAQLLATAAVLAWNFFANKFWTFQIAA